MKHTPHTQKNAFERFALLATRATGSTAAFMIAAGVILAWVVTGPIFKYSDTWQLIINTSTTIITFLMVFLIQKTQNKDSLALHIKLNELVASSERASNRIVDIEDLSEEELRVLDKYYSKLAELAKKEMGLQSSHSIDDAEDVHEEKVKKNPRAKAGK